VHLDLDFLQGLDRRVVGIDAVGVVCGVLLWERARTRLLA